MAGRKSIAATIALCALGASGPALGATAFQAGAYKGTSSKGDDVSFTAGTRITKAKFHLAFDGGCPSGTYTFPEHPRIKDGAFRLVHTYKKDKVTVKGHLTGTTAKGSLKAVVYGRVRPRGRAGTTKCTASYTWKAQLKD
jgi:hypothetical protein